LSLSFASFLSYCEAQEYLSRNFMGNVYLRSYLHVIGKIASVWTVT